MEVRLLVIECLPQAADEFENRFNALFRRAYQRASNHYSISETSDGARLIGRRDAKPDADWKSGC
jgi:hypothetical protein